MSNMDAVILHLNQVTTAKYTQAVRERNNSKQPITCFLVDEISNALKQDYQDLLTNRQSNVEELKRISNQSFQKNSDFTKNLISITEQLQEARQRSIELHQSTQQLSADFSKVTDQLDYTTNLVTKAEEMSILIRFIQEFNKDGSFKDLCKRLPSLNFPESPYIQAELIAKLIKIVQNAEIENQTGKKDADTLKNAKLNLDYYKQMLRQTLDELFEQKKETPYEQAQIAQALTFLQSEEVAILDFINSTPLMQPEQNNIKYSEKVSYMPPEEQIERYQYLCDFFYKDCKTSWRNLDIIFDKSQQSKTTLIQYVWNEVFKPFVTHVLDYTLASPDRTSEQFCQLLYNLYTITKDMMKNIWAIDKQIFTSSTIIEETFQPYQIEYEIKETQCLGEKMKTLVLPYINKFRAVIEKESKTFSFGKNEEKYDIFADLDQDIPISILKEGSAAWERCITLCTPNKMQQILKNLIDMIVQSNLREYITTYLEAVKLCIKKETDLNVIPQYLSITATFNSAILTLDEKYNVILKKALAQKPSAQEKFIREKEQLITNIEQNIRQGLEILINIVVEKVKQIVSTKVFKTLYAKEDTNASPSKPCKDICRIIEGSPGRPGMIHNIAVLTQDNKMSFAAVMTRRMWEVIADAYYDNKYNFPYGTTQLQMDIDEFKRVFGLFNLSVIDRKLEEFSIACKIITSPPEMITDVQKKLNPSQNSLNIAKKLIVCRLDAKENDLLALLSDKPLA